MRMAENPEICLRDKLRPVIGIRRIKVVTRAVQNTDHRSMVCHDHGTSSKWFAELLRKPGT